MKEGVADVRTSLARSHAHRRSTDSRAEERDFQYLLLQQALYHIVVYKKQEFLA